MEKGGGASSYGAGSVLDLKIHKTEDRTQVNYATQASKQAMQASVIAR